MVFVSHKHKFIFIHIPKTGGLTIKKTLSKNIKNNFKKKDCSTIGYITMNKNCILKTKYNIVLRSPRHYSLNDLNKLYDSNYFRFTFVRNPYDRFYSLYLHFKRRLLKFLYIFISVNIITLIIIAVLIYFKKYLFMSLLLISLIIFDLYLCLYLKLIKISYETINYDFNIFCKRNIHFLLNSILYDIFKPQYMYILNNRLDFIGKQETFKKDFKNLLNKLNIKSEIQNSNIHKPNNFIKYKYLNKYSKETIKIINKIYSIDFHKFGYNMV